jgi:hypothetical protein
VTEGCHHFGRAPAKEWLSGLNATICGRSKAPVNSATTGASSIAPIELPQTGQNARDDPDDDRNTAGAPPGPVQLTDALGYSTQHAVKAPVWRWHIRQ